MDITDPNSGKILAELDAGGKKRSDEVDYDPNTKKGMVANSDDAFVTIVDMTGNTIAKKIDLPGGALEQPRYNPTDKFMYLTGSEDNVLYQFDMNSMAMTKKMDIGDQCNPNGIAINPTANIAVLACSNSKNQHLAVWDFKTSKVTSTTDKAGACDGDIYDAKADKFFVACSNFYRGGQMAIVSGDGKFITNVPTAVGSHGVAYDEPTNTVYTQDQLPSQGVLFSFVVPAK
jgi:DNA-binding beta-propeller fold protein YncE